MVEGALSRIAVNDASIFAVDEREHAIVELTRDGELVGRIPALDAITAIVAHGDWVAWIEVEGTGKILRKRAGAAANDTIRGFEPHLVASEEGAFYSDLGLIASWVTSPPERIATPEAGAALIGVDTSHAYTREPGAAVVKYARGGDAREVVMASAEGATVRAGQLAYRTADGIRLRDLFTSFDRVIGAPPADYACELLIAGSVVLCGKYRARDGTLDVLLRDPIDAYTAAGGDVFWLARKGDSTAIYQADAEATLPE